MRCTSALAVFFRPCRAPSARSDSSGSALAPGASPLWRKRTAASYPLAKGTHMEQFHGTTIVSVRRGDKVALGGDGQVTLGNIVMKGGAKKVRRIYNGQVLV